MEEFPSVTVLLISVSLIVLVNYLWGGSKAPLTTRARNQISLNLPSVGIVGAGAIGTVTGLSLAATTVARVLLVGQKNLVTTVAANQEQLRYLDKSRKGAHQQLLFKVRIRNSLPTTRIPEGQSTRSNATYEAVTVTENLHDLVAFQCSVILVATKATATQSIGESLAKILPLDSNVTIVSLQNGIGNAQILRTALKHHENIQVLSSMVNFNASWELGTNLFVKNSHGNVNLERPKKEGPGSSNINNNNIHGRLVDALAAAMAENHLVVNVVSNISADLHGKLLINLFNAVNALAGLSTPGTLQKTGYRRVWAAAMLEGLAIYRQLGIATSSFWGIPPTVLPWLLKLPVPEILFRLVLSSLDKMGETSRSSMLQDLERGRTPTEVNYLCGEIVRLGKEINMKAPVNEALVRLVQAAEVAGKGSPRLTDEELLRQVGLEEKKTTPTTTGRPRNVTYLSNPFQTPRTQARPHRF
jgi:2-dehydropantoate 2-reductase